jgi:hypothetical protein
MPMLTFSPRLLARSPVWVARGAALLAAALTLCNQDVPWGQRAFLAILQVAAVLTTTRRRWRFPAAVCLGTLAVAELFVLLVQARTDTFLSTLPLTCVALHATASLALLWPRARASAATQPLPALPATWVIQSTLAAVVGRAVLLDLARIDGSLGAEVLAASGLAALAYFALLQLGSYLGRWRWVAQLAAAAATAAILMLIPFSRSGAFSDPGGVLLLVLGPGLFALGLDWIRAPLTPAGRFVRGVALAAVSALPAPLIAAQGQAFAPRLLAMVLANAGAFGVAAALAPRLASTRSRPGELQWMAAPPSRVLAAIVGATALFCLNVYVLNAGDAQPHPTMYLVPVVTGVVAAVVSCFRARTARALIWLAAGTGLVGAALPALGDGTRDPNFLLVAAALADVVGFALLSRVFVSRRVTAHFQRRRRPSFSVAPRASLGLAGVSAVLGAAALAAAFTPAKRGRLLDLVAGPVPVEAPVLYAPVTPSAQSPVSAPGAVAVDPLGRGVWVADEETNQVELVSGRDVHRIAVGKWPEQVVVDTQGFAYVSCREAGEVDRIAPDFSVTAFPVGREPRALALDDARHRLYVGLVAESAVRAIDTGTGAVRGSFPLTAAPASLALTPQGVAVLPRLGSEVSYLDPGLTRERRVALPANERRAWHGQALVPVGEDLVVVYAAVDTGLTVPVPTGGYGGGVDSPVELRVAVLHQGQPAVYPARIERSRTVQGADITGAVVGGDALYLASRGTSHVMGVRFAEMDRAGLRGGLFVSNQPRVTQETAGGGLNGLAYGTDGRLHTFAAFPREEVSLDVSDVDPREPPGLAIAAHTALGQGALAPELAKGRELFYRANENLISAANLSCAVCHPDGRDDGLVWRFHGSRLRTPFLADRISDTAPYNWHGTEPTLEGNIRQTIRRLGGKGLADEDVKALARYLREGLRRPAAGTGCDSSLVALGRSVFERPDVGCAGCHVPESGFTDGSSHDVGSLSAREREEIRSTLAEAASQPTQRDAPPPDGPRTVREAEQFDTPSLRHLADSPPYFHDGAAPSLAAVVADNRDRMGKTSHLSAHDREALVAYLKSL